MITKKNLQDLSKQLSSIYKKGLEAAEKKNTEYAIELLKVVVIEEPGFAEARKKLRALEKQAPQLSPIKALFRSVKLKKLIRMAQLDFVRNRYKEALSTVEEALVLDVTYLPALDLLAQIMLAQKASFIAIETYELAKEFYPNSPAVLQNLANTYRDNKMGNKELEIRQKLCRMFPDNLDMESELRSATASAMLEKHELEKESSFDHLKDKEETEFLEQKERIVRDIDDVEKLIKKYENNLNENPKSLPALKSLGELYSRANVHDKALEYFEKFESLSDILDITADKAKEKSELALIDDKISKLNEEKNTNTSDSSKIEKNIAELESKVKSIKKSYAEKRVDVYPNDLVLRYALAQIYWEEKEIDLAIEQFQIAQKNLKYHNRALIYLGRCFICKKQYDIAIEQLKNVIDKLPIMNEQKMEALYYLGIAYEETDSENAKECFKQIYSVQATYKDVSKRIQKYY